MDNLIIRIHCIFLRISLEKAHQNDVRHININVMHGIKTRLQTELKSCIISLPKQ